MNSDEITKRIAELEQQLALLPVGTLIYKNINGKNNHIYSGQKTKNQNSDTLK